MQQVLLLDDDEIDTADICGWTALFHASSRGKSDIVKYLLEKGANATLTDMEGNNCLHIASQSWARGLDCCKLLVQEKMLVNIQNNKGETPLHLVTTEQHEEICTILIENGADPNIKDKKEQTSLHCAAKKGNFKSLKLLIDKKAAVWSVDNDGKTCLHYSSECSNRKHGKKDGNLQCVELLVVSGAEIDAKDNEGRTALFCASTQGYTDIVNYLYGKGANPNLEDNEGNTCLHIARRNKTDLFECVKLLVDRFKIAVNSKNHKHETPLHIFASEGDKDIVAFLLKRGADPNLKTRYGQTSIDYAVVKGHFEIEQLLIKSAKSLQRPSRMT
jgi:ankyrin repeat protein